MKKLIVFVLCFVLFVGNAHAADTWGASGSQAAIGSDIMTNGSFGDSSGWTLGTGWSISGGKATHDDAQGAGDLSRSITVAADTYYHIEWTSSAFDVTAPGDDKYYRFKINGVHVPSYNSVENQVAGVEMGGFYSASSGSVTLKIEADAYLEASFDDIKVYPVSASSAEALLNDSSGTEFFQIRGLFSKSNLYVGNPSGKFNIASLGSDTGGNNTALGKYAMYQNISGTSNTALGYYALYTNFSGFNNVAFGKDALYNNKGGFQNTAIGSTAMYDNTSGAYNVAVGAQALSNQENNAIHNIAIGVSAMSAPTNPGNYNIALGYSALSSASYTGAYSLALGQNALRNCTTGYYNQAVGVEALNATTTGSANTAIGHQGLSSNTTGNDNVAVGYQAGLALVGSYNDNVFLGTQAAYDQTAGSNNIAIGSVSLPNTGTGNQLNIGNLYRGDLDDGVAMLGTTTVSSYDASLELGQTNRALILNRLTTTQMNAITDPENGMVIYNTTTGKFTGYAGGAWVALH